MGILTIRQGVIGIGAAALLFFNSPSNNEMPVENLEYETGVALASMQEDYDFNEGSNLEYSGNAYGATQKIDTLKRFYSNSPNSVRVLEGLENQLRAFEESKKAEKNNTLRFNPNPHNLTSFMLPETERVQPTIKTEETPTTQIKVMSNEGLEYIYTKCVGLPKADNLPDEHLKFIEQRIDAVLGSYNRDIDKGLKAEYKKLKTETKIHRKKYVAGLCDLLFKVITLVSEVPRENMTEQIFLKTFDALGKLYNNAPVNQQRGTSVIIIDNPPSAIMGNSQKANIPSIGSLNLPNYAISQALISNSPVINPNLASRPNLMQRPPIQYIFFLRP